MEKKKRSLQNPLSTEVAPKCLITDTNKKRSPHIIKGDYVVLPHFSEPNGIQQGVIVFREKDAKRDINCSVLYHSSLNSGYRYVDCNITKYMNATRRVNIERRPIEKAFSSGPKIIARSGSFAKAEGLMDFGFEGPQIGCGSSSYPLAPAKKKKKKKKKSEESLK